MQLNLQMGYYRCMLKLKQCVEPKTRPMQLDLKPGPAWLVFPLHSTCYVAVFALLFLTPWMKNIDYVFSYRREGKL